MLRSILKFGLIGGFALLAAPLAFASGAEAASAPAPAAEPAVAVDQADDDADALAGCTSSFQCPVSKPYCRNGHCTSNPFGRQ